MTYTVALGILGIGAGLLGATVFLVCRGKILRAVHVVRPAFRRTGSLLAFVVAVGCVVLGVLARQAQLDAAEAHGKISPDGVYCVVCQEPATKKTDADYVVSFSEDGQAAWLCDECEPPFMLTGKLEEVHGAMSEECEAEENADIIFFGGLLAAAAYGAFGIWLLGWFGGGPPVVAEVVDES